MNGCDGKCVLAKGEKKTDVLFSKSLYTLIYNMRVRA